MVAAFSSSRRGGPDVEEKLTSLSGTLRGPASRCAVRLFMFPCLSSWVRTDRWVLAEVVDVVAPRQPIGLGPPGHEVGAVLLPRLPTKLVGGEAAAVRMPVEKIEAFPVAQDVPTSLRCPLRPARTHRTPRALRGRMSGVGAPSRSSSRINRAKPERACSSILMAGCLRGAPNRSR